MLKVFFNSKRTSRYIFLKNQLSPSIGGTLLDVKIDIFAKKPIPSQSWLVSNLTVDVRIDKDPDIKGNHPIKVLLRKRRLMNL